MGGHDLLGHVGGTSGWSLAITGALVPAGAYVALVGQWSRRARPPWDPRRTGWFLGGCLLLFAALAPPLDAAAASLPSAHMIQHLLLGMYAPIGLALGAPLTLLAGSLEPGSQRRLRAVTSAPAARVATNLWVVTAANVGGLYLVYLTPVYALSTRSDLVHHGIHLHLLVAGYLFVWAVCGPDPVRGRAPLAGRTVALVLTLAAHNILAKLLYARSATLPPDGGWAVHEAEAAAQWMYYGGQAAEIVLAVTLFSVWYRRAPANRRLAAIGSATDHHPG